jgi:hypothetical protein
LGFFLKNFFIIDLFLYKFIKNNKKKKLNKVVYIPDPGELKYKFSKKYAQKYLKLSKNNFYILVYGAIKMSKGIKELLNSAKNFNDNTAKKQIQQLIQFIYNINENEFEIALNKIDKNRELFSIVSSMNSDYNSGRDNIRITGNIIAKDFLLASEKFSNNEALCAFRVE